jgi:hypothetical protein
MARLPRCDPLLDALVRDAFASIERGERCRDPRDLRFVVVEIRRDRFGREERARASRGACHFFEALFQRVSNAHGDGCGARRIHNVLHCITGGEARHEGSLWRISHKLEKQSANFGSGTGLEIMRTGCDVHHGFRERTDSRGAGLSRRLPIGSGVPMSGGPCRKQAIC